MTANRFTAQDVMRETNTGRSQTYEYLARWESQHPNCSVRDENGNWSFNRATFSYVTRFINRQRQTVNV